MWVDDALIAAVGVFGTKMTLAAVIEAIFAVMGEPDAAEAIPFGHGQVRKFSSC